MSDNKVKEKKIILLVFLIGVFILGIYEYFERKDIEKQGVCTKATVINSESYKGGLMITVSYKYLEKHFEAKVIADLGKSEIGDQYFIRFYSHSPQSIVFLIDKPVPECLTYIDPPKEGWYKIPSCP